MALPLPSTLSPSKVSSFTDCALAFRFSAIDHLPEPPSPAAVRGTLVHAALERLYDLAPAERTPERAQSCLDEAWGVIASDPEFIELGLDDEAAALMLEEARPLVDNIFRLEDPSSITPVGLELFLEFELDGLRLRGIIDRLEVVDGRLVVTDYKTGKAPGQTFEQGRLTGVQFYALLCERLFGQRPERVQLIYLGGAEPQVIIHRPSDKIALGTERRLRAIWQAVEKACANDDFRPKPSKLCDWCAFQAYCPVFGGDPAQAAALRPPPLAAAS